MAGTRPLGRAWGGPLDVTSSRWLLAALLAAVGCTVWFYEAQSPAHRCPRDCSGNGSCLKGRCFCRAPYGGEGCSQSSVDLMGREWASEMDLRLGVGDRCSFLVRDEVMVRDDGGGDGGGEVFYGQTGRLMYHVAHDLMALLPDHCPELQWRQCAIVGNSGALLLERFGREIDEHDMVVRFNQAPTQLYEEHVGSRTTIESLNTRFARLAAEAAGQFYLAGQNSTSSGRKEWLSRTDDAALLLFEPKRLKAEFAQLRERLPNRTVYMLGPQFTEAVTEMYERLRVNLTRLGFGCMRGEKAMSGFFSVMLALRNCQQVDLYGFDPWQDYVSGARPWKYHYMDAEEPRAGAHSYELTFYTYVLLELSTEYNLRIRRVKMPQPRARKWLP